MRTLFIALLLSFQVASSQQYKPMIRPCEKQDIAWGSNVKQLTDFAHKNGMKFYDMTAQNDDGIMYVTYNTPKYTRVYSFMNGEYIGNVTIIMEEDAVKRHAKMAEQVELYIADSDVLVGENNFKYECKGDAIYVKLSETTASVLIIVTNPAAAMRAK